MNFLNRIISCLITLLAIENIWVHSSKLCRDCRIYLMVQDLQQCKQFCSIDTDPSHQLALNGSTWKVELICRTDSFLSVHVDTDVEDDKIGGVVYKLLSHESQHPLYYLVDSVRNIQFGNLFDNSLYNLSVTVYNKELEIIAKSQEYQFHTLPTNYIPGKARNITLQGIKIDKNNPKKVSALVKWEPSEDRNCHFQIESTTGDKSTINVQKNGNATQQFSCEIKNLTLGATLKVKIRSRRMEVWFMQGDRVEKTFQIPSCLETYKNNLTICEPEKPQGLQLKLHYRMFGPSSMEVSWMTPSPLPVFYELLISQFIKGIPISTSIYTIPGDMNRTVSKGFRADGFEVEVTLEAHSEGGVSKATVFQSIPRVQISDKDVLLLGLLGVVVSLFFLLPAVVLITFVTDKRGKRKCKEKQQNRSRDAEAVWDVLKWLEKDSNALY